jgi:hypothetical protein
MLFRTGLDSVLFVDEKKLLSQKASDMFKSINFTKDPIEFSGYSFPTIYEFDDDKGTADMNQIPNDKAHWFLHKTADLLWQPFKLVDNESGIFEAKELNSNGSFKFVVRFPGKDKRDTDLPHLLLTPEATSIDFQIDSINATFNSTKFGLETIFLTTDMNLDKSKKKTLDDEYTPGTFTLWSVLNKNSNSSVTSFFQWKPIFYYNKPKSLENSTLTMQYEFSSNESVPLGLGSVFFASSVSTLKGMNISLGLQGDHKNGYYYDGTFSSVTFAVGLGAAPLDKMSPIVSLVIFIGFGLPALVIVAGIIVMGVKKIRGRRSEFQPL